MAVPYPFLRRGTFCAALLLTFAVAANSQTNSINVIPRGIPTYNLKPRSISVDVNLVLVPVSVTDSLHHPVLNLEQKNFELYESNSPQPIRYFYRQDEPISIALVLDISGSMAEKADLLREAVKQFFDNANARDDYCVITVSTRPEVLTRGSQSIDDIELKLANTNPAGWTALLDSVDLAVMALKNARYPRRVILIVSDGMDNSSRRHLKDVVSLVEESEIDAYAIGVKQPAVPLLGALTERIDKKLLMHLTDVTGGHTVVVESPKDLPAIAAQMSQEMRSEYVLGFRPPVDAHDRKWRKIEVRLKETESADLRTYYRKGYTSPGD